MNELFWDMWMTIWSGDYMVAYYKLSPNEGGPYPQSAAETAQHCFARFTWSSCASGLSLLYHLVFHHVNNL